MIHTREEIRGQKEQLAEQNKSLEHQNFEQSFYQLLNLYDKTVNEIRLGRTEEGRQVFRFIYHFFNMTVNYSGPSSYPGLFEKLLGHLEIDEVEEETLKKIILPELETRFNSFNLETRSGAFSSVKDRCVVVIPFLRLTP